jgi:transposase
MPNGRRVLRAGQRLLGRQYAHEHLAVVLAAYYQSFVSLTRSIQALDKQLGMRERAARLETIPKVGRIASLTFLAAVDQVGRFGTSRQLVSYSGLCPTVRSSGERTAIVALARKLLTIAYRLLKDQTVYRSSLVGRAA